MERKIDMVVRDPKKEISLPLEGEVDLEVKIHWDLFKYKRVSSPYLQSFW